MVLVFIYWERAEDGSADFKHPHSIEIDMTGKDAAEIMFEYTVMTTKHDSFRNTPIEFCGII